jgi:hypothetical protein|tara:strand:+ start:347 stop:652 length:306 start_codon:yes stop_codon:yes gene_type:complete
MDINKVIELIREAKKASKCPPGFKYSKKKKSCVAVRKKGKYIGVRGYYGGYRGGDNRSDSGNDKDKGNGNGNGNGHGGNGNGNGGNGGGNGGGGNGGGGGE